ncbi:MAG TPA: zinc ribbon domain-containing protein [Polyangiaceae bacterium]|jgi:putative FmdB family regulatory protein|nr:zinc ribbon domain-containing protein [Polyangiaceae bacterium]
MPLYEYECSEHGVFDDQRRMSEFAAPSSCPVCARPAPRVLSAARIRGLPRAELTARDRNERSAHEPRILVRARDAPLAPRQPGQACESPSRPWMLGH